MNNSQIKLCTGLAVSAVVICIIAALVLHMDNSEVRTSQKKQIKKRVNKQVDKKRKWKSYKPKHRTSAVYLKKGVDIQKIARFTTMPSWAVI